MLLSQPLKSTLALALGIVLASCSPRQEPALTSEPGDPLPQIEGTALTQFERGRAVFDSDFGEDEGLGPSFNQMRCSSCHDVPVVGGGGVEVVRKATTTNQAGQCDELRSEGGPLFQSRVTARVLSEGGAVETIPDRATHVATLNPPALYAGGLIESIPIAEIAARADPQDLDGDGVSGRIAGAATGLPGRFGLKSEHGTIRSFVTEALLTEMGVTTSQRPRDLSVNGVPFDDGVADPELSDADVDLIVAFISLLAPVGSRDVADSDSARVIEAGAALFEQVGCAACHTPYQRAGRGAPGGAEGRQFPLYSDLLLHDLGPGAAGHCTPDALPTEWRTAPLAGLRYRAALFHDGRATSVSRAIERHGGEASLALSRYLGLDVSARMQLLQFLSTL